MPTNTARGLVVPNLTGDGADLHQMLLDLANSIEAMMNSPLVLGSSLTVPGDVISTGGAFESRAAGFQYSLYDSGAGADLKRARLSSAAGVTTLRSLTDAVASRKVGLSMDHATGVVDHPNGLSGTLAGSFGGTLTGDLTHTGTKVGFNGATPIAKPGATNDLKASLVSLGLVTGGGATPLDLNGGALTVGGITASSGIGAAGGVSSGGVLSSTGGSSFTGTGSLGSGQSVEVGLGGGVGIVQAYDRSGSAFMPLQVVGSTVEIMAGAVERIRANSTGIGFFGQTPSAQRGTFQLTLGSNFTRTLPQVPTTQQVSDFVRQLAADLGGNGFGLIATANGA